MIWLDIDDGRSMNQVSTRNINSPVRDLIKFGHTQSDWVVSVRTTGSEHSFLFTFEFWWGDFRLLVVVIIETDVEDEDQPYVSIIFEALQAAGVNLIYKGQASTGIFYKPTLSRSSEFFPIDRVKITNWSNYKRGIKLIHHVSALTSNAWRVILVVQVFCRHLFLFESHLYSISELRLRIYEKDVDESIEL